MELFLPQERRQTGPLPLSTIHITHKGETLTWDASKFIKTKIKQPARYFELANRFLSELPVERHDKLFDCYKRIQDAFNQLGPEIIRHRAIVDSFAALCRLIPWEEFYAWTHKRGCITIPMEIPTDFDGTQHHGVTREKTYDKDQYWDLAALGQYMKFLLPPLAVAIIEKDTRSGKTLKEQRTYQLLSRTGIDDLPLINRLRVYIAAFTDRYSMPASAILESMSSAELPSFILSRTVIRKIMLAELDDNIIKMTHHYVKQQLDGLDKGFSGIVQDKRMNKGKSEEDNISVAENYRVRQPLSDGDLGTLAYYSQQLETLSYKVDPTLDRAKLNICINNVKRRPLVPSEPHQKTLTQWVIGTAMPARGIASLNRLSLMHNMAVAQALLWHWGFHEMALLMMVQSPSDVTGAFVPNNRTNLSRHWHTEFQKRFPHYREPTTKSKDVRHQNVAYQAIEGPNTNNPNMPGLATMILRNAWIPHGPEELLEYIPSATTGEYWPAPSDTRDQLANLICFLYDLRYGKGAH